jgi:hypothetical protein
MKNKGDLSTWWYWDLLKEDRKWGPYAMQAENVRAELKRRNELWKMWGIWLGIAAVAGGALAKVFGWFISK